jgi:hypothetical protein
MLVLSYFFYAAPVLVALAMGLLMPLLLVLTFNRFTFGLILIFATFLVDTVTMGDGSINVGINLYYPDIGLGLIAASASLRLLFAKDVPSRSRSWLFFTLVVVISLVTGLISFGTSAGVQARSYFYFVVTGLYGMSFAMTPQRIQGVLNALALTAFALIGLAFYRWAVYFTPITSLLPPGGTYNIDGPIRVIYSNHALVVAQVLVASFFYVAAARGFNAARLFSPLFLGMVLVLQHRSVWLAALVGVMIRFLLGNSKDGSAARQLLLVCAIVALTAAPLALSDKFSGITQQIGTGASSALAGEGTTGERLQSWGEIVKNWYGAGVRSIAIGQSFGTDNSRFVKDNRGEVKKIDYIAHNLYVQTLFNTGILGLMAYLAANWYVVAGLYRMCRNDRGGVTAEVLMVLMVMQLAYYVPYGVDFLQSFLFGVALAYVAGNRAASIGASPTARLYV